MSEKCAECGRRLKGDETECPNCGKSLYSSVFGDISAEIDAEMQNITEDDIRRVNAENSGDGKMTYEEFCDFYKARVKAPPPWFMVKARLRYEQLLLPKQYERYLKYGLKSQ